MDPRPFPKAAPPPNGKVVRVRSFMDRTQALEAAGLSE
jgi:hypothetical protein